MAFYRPDKKRYKMVVDGHAFPSDRVSMDFPEPDQTCELIA